MKTLHTLHIRNMVCPRCLRTVEETLRGLGLKVKRVRLGEALVSSSSKELDATRVDDALKKEGFELLLDKDAQRVETIKVALLEYVNRLEAGEKMPRVSSYLSDKIPASYSSMSRIFSRQQRVTIERYLILLKIEKVKELLGYGELTVSEIAYRLHYSSVQHLSSQFRSVTGVPPSQLKGAGIHHRHPLDRIV